MKKKVITLVTTLFIISVIAVSLVYAAENNTTKDKTCDPKSMLDLKRDQIDKALERGEITQEEAQKQLEHFNSMQKFHETNGTGPCGKASWQKGTGKQGNCRVQGGGMMGNHGAGMMSNF